MRPRHGRWTALLRPRCRGRCVGRSAWVDDKGRRLGGREKEGYHLQQRAIRRQVRSCANACSRSASVGAFSSWKATAT